MRGGFAAVFHYCLRDSFRNGIRNCAFTALLSVLVAALVAYSVALPSFLMRKQQDAQTISWDTRCFFETDSQSNYLQLAEYLRDNAGARSAASFTTNAAFLRKVSSQAEKQEVADAVDVCMLHANNSDIWPIDAYSGDAAVLAGNPYEGYGTIVDACLAQKFGLKVGDTFYLGMEVPSGAALAQSLNVSVTDQTTGETQQETWDNCAWFPFEVNAIVIPDDNFSGIACLRPQENIVAFEDRTETFATELLVFGKADAIGKAMDGLGPGVVADECYTERAEALIRQAHDEYNGERTSSKAYRLFLVLLGGAVAACLVVDAFRKIRRRKVAFLVFRMLGLGSKTIMMAALFEGVCAITLLVLVGYTAGLIWVEQSFLLWIPMAFKALCAGVLVVATAALSLLQPVFTQRVLNEERVTPNWGGSA